MTVRVSSPWAVSSGSLSSLPLVLASLSEDSLESVTSPETCVLLSKGEEDVRGEVVLETPPGQVVTGVTITSSSSRWEVVGGIQYIASIQGDRLWLGEEEQDEDIPLFSGSLAMDRGHGKVVLRLPSGNIQSCWIFSLGITVERTLSPPPLSHFSMSSVDSLLSSSSLPLSEKAQQFRTMFQSFQTSGPMAGSLPGPGQYMGDQSSDAPSGTSGGDFSSGSLLLLKSYIDQKFVELEERLVRSVETAARQHNDKLDSILLLLSSTTATTLESSHSQ